MPGLKACRHNASFDRGPSLITRLSEPLKKLSNPSFLKKAPEEVIDQFNKQASEIKSSIEKIDQIIDTIK